ncbi:hypothetical protein FJ437_19285 [Mesorhizobium sp. B2-6-6]|nr:hypothetical protein FJ437_19285 [Mesorhizobium sp. B2-6-6]
MKKILLAVAVVAAFGIWVGGIRIIVIQPIGAIPNGVTVLVAGINANLVDSPDAMCQRIQGGVSLLCRGVMAGAIAKEGKILLRLPYSKILFRMSGAPYLTSDDEGDQ